ncbi:MAG: flagellar brake protein [Burkholderiaceae bacterium]|nr:flagellar brake protein [Burkholderiaceae bacterium]
MPSKLGLKPETPQAGTDLSDFRIDASPEILGYLRDLMKGQVRIHLSSPGDLTLQTQIWAFDAAKDVLAFDLSTADTRVAEALRDSDEVTAVAYLDAVKLQFELENLVIVSDSDGKVLRASVPRQMFRFQRRQAFRVQPTGNAYPRLVLNHPHDAALPLRLRVLDISIGGIAAQLPSDVPDFRLGTTIRETILELDRETHLSTSVRLQRVSRIEHGGGTQLGFAFGELNAQAIRDLQVYIDQTQKRRRQFGLPA